MFAEQQETDQEKDVNHKEASYSWELALSSNALGGELPATGGILTTEC